VTPSEFRKDLDTHKTRMNGLSCGEESMTICLGRFDTVPACDGWTENPDRIGIAKMCFSISDARKK